MSGHRPLLMQNITSFCTRQRPKVAWSNKSKMKIRKKDQINKAQQHILKSGHGKGKVAAVTFRSPKEAP